MCEALRELMKDDIDEAVNKAVNEAVAKTRVEVSEEVSKKTLTNNTLDIIRKMMKNLKLTATQAMQVLEIPESEQSMFASML